jgi:hypothetical protein
VHRFYGDLMVESVQPRFGGSEWPIPLRSGKITKESAVLGIFKLRKLIWKNDF